MDLREQKEAEQASCVHDWSLYPEAFRYCVKCGKEENR